MYGHSLGLSMNPGPSASALETFSSAAAVFSYSTRRAIGERRKIIALKISYRSYIDVAPPGRDDETWAV